MFVTLNNQALINILQTYLAIRIGEMQFGPLDTCVFTLALGAALLSVLNLWRIAQHEDRQQQRIDALRRAPLQSAEPAHAPRLPWCQRLGTMVAATQIIGTAEQEKLLAALVAAGVKGHGHLSARRRVRLETGIPDALDLLVICAEAGLSLDHAIEQVGRVLGPSNPEVAEEFAMTAAEMRVSPVRSQALEHLAMRTGLTSLRGIVATLNQAINFGTPLAESLRVLTAEMRAQRLARFEERAARLPVLLTLPLMAFILPSLLIVIGTPLALRIIDMLGRGL